MLNICMERRRLREGGLPFSMTHSKEKKTTNSGQHEESEEDEFYDCSDDDENDNDKYKDIAPWNKPVGRESRLGNLTLIDSDEPLYVPITQESVPKTEDQLEDDAEVMLKLGPNSGYLNEIMKQCYSIQKKNIYILKYFSKINFYIRTLCTNDECIIAF